MPTEYWWTVYVDGVDQFGGHQRPTFIQARARFAARVLDRLIPAGTRVACCGVSIRDSDPIQVLPDGRLIHPGHTPVELVG